MSLNLIYHATFYSFHVKTFGTKAHFVRLDQKFTFRIILPLEDNAFVAFFLCIRTATTNRLSALDTYFFRRFAGVLQIKKKSKRVKLS